MQQLQIFDTLCNEHETPLLSNTMLSEFTVCGFYELDGIKYRLTKWRESGIMTFQELNADGSDYIKYYTNSEGEPTQVKDWGERLIGRRLNEMGRVGK